jgi:DNA-binding transcriptional MerR regulator
LGADATSGVEIPSKVFFRIGEVGGLTGVKPYVLRYWETEFRHLRPRKSKTGQRLYRRNDIEMILRIKELLWARKFTIAGARTELSRGVSTADKAPASAPARPPEVIVRPDPELVRKVDELQLSTKELEEQNRTSEVRARRANARAEQAEKRAARAERLVDELMTAANRQGHDLRTTRDALRLLRSTLHQFLDDNSP